MEGEARFGGTPRLDAVAAADPVDVVPGAPQGRRHRQSRARMAAGAAAGDDDPHGLSETRGRDR